MHANPDLKFLQQVVVFFIIYYLYHRGRENLRQMAVNTFAIERDPETNLHFIYQAIDKDKNHSHLDIGKANQNRIYAVPCKFETYIFG